MKQIQLNSGEEWRDVPGYEGYYKASSAGRIMSLRRAVIKNNGVNHPIKGRIFKSPALKSYNNLSLCKDGVIWSIALHRIIAMTFIPNPENKREVNHKNGIKYDNRLKEMQHEQEIKRFLNYNLIYH